MRYLLAALALSSACANAGTREYFFREISPDVSEGWEMEPKPQVVEPRQTHYLGSVHVSNSVLANASLPTKFEEHYASQLMSQSLWKLIWDHLAQRNLNSEFSAQVFKKSRSISPSAGHLSVSVVSIFRSGVTPNRVDGWTVEFFGPNGENIYTLTNSTDLKMQKPGKGPALSAHLALSIGTATEVRNNIHHQGLPLGQVTAVMTPLINAGGGFEILGGQNPVKLDQEDTQLLIGHTSFFDEFKNACSELLFGTPTPKK